MSEAVLITGGLGYIGSRLAAEMLKRGMKVRLGTRVPERALPPELAGCQTIHTDFSSSASLKEACAGVQQVVHLAAMNDSDCARDPEAAFEVNVLGTLRLVEAARATAVERSLYLSTAHVYRSPLVGTFNEGNLPRPTHPYGITHKAAEDIILAAKGMTGVVIRLANGFGAPVHSEVNCWTLLVNDLCRQAVTARKLVLKSTGQQQRNFVTLTDATAAICHFLQVPGTDLGDGIFNIGGRHSMTVLAMTELIAERCEKILGYRPPLQRMPGDDLAPSLHFDISKAEKAGFCPSDNYVAEIDDCLNFCRETFAKPAP